jgi:hypothetical protein
MLPEAAPTPRSLQGRYQLIALGAEGDTRAAGYAGDLERAVALAMRHLGANPTRMLARLGLQSGIELDRKMPSVTVFFGTVAAPALSPEDTVLLDVLRHTPRS